MQTSKKKTFAFNLKWEDHKIAYEAVKSQPRGRETQFIIDCINFYMRVVVGQNNSVQEQQVTLPLQSDKPIFLEPNIENLSFYSLSGSEDFAQINSIVPVVEPKVEPTVEPTVEPKVEPTVETTVETTVEPTEATTEATTVEPTEATKEAEKVTTNEKGQIVDENGAEW